MTKEQNGPVTLLAATAEDDGCGRAEEKEMTTEQNGPATLLAATADDEEDWGVSDCVPTLGGEALELDVQDRILQLEATAGLDARATAAARYATPPRSARQAIPATR